MNGRPRLASLVAVTAAAVLTAAGLAGCRDGAETVDAERPSTPRAPRTTPTVEPPTSELPPDPGATRASDGCGTDPGDPGDDGILQRSISSSGGRRDFLVVLPGSYDPGEPAPLVVVFHGAGSSKEQQLLYSGFTDTAGRDGALLVLPDALGEPTRRWSPYGVGIHGVEGVDDLAFFADLLDEVERGFCVDRTRVAVTGMSSGGYMSAAAACAYSDRIAAAAPVTATMWAEGACGDAAPMPYVYFHGTDDPVVPFLGPVPGPDGEPGPGSAETSTAQWAEHNGCDPEPVDERLGDDVLHRRWTGCDAPTDLYIIDGGGHTWPGALPVPRLGRTTDTISATEIIWDLFRSSERSPA